MMEFVALVKAVLSWPVAAVAIALAYKPELLKALPDFLRRKLKLEGFGFKAEIDTAEQQQAAENPANEKLPEKPTLDLSSRPAVNLMETQLRKDLVQIDPAKREAVLVRALAEARLSSGHEFTYNRIFGSQILGLRQLNSAGQATVNDAHEFFKSAEAQYPQIYANYGFNGWLSYLVNSGLIAREGDVLRITDIGRDFLLYLTDKRLFEGKAG